MTNRVNFSPTTFPAMREAERFQTVLDALTAHVALVDRDATIAAVNAAWRRFADDNAYGLPAHGIGCNYLELLESVTCPTDGTDCDNDMRIAARVAEGLRGTLTGRMPMFQLEYPCHSPTEQRWFLLTITRFAGDGPLGAIIAHENVTALKLAEQRASDNARQLAESFSAMIGAIALALEQRDPYTAGHQRQVAQLCDRIARHLGLDAHRRYGLHLGATVHDIGKISVPAEILSKPGRLNELEMSLTKLHPRNGYEVLANVHFPWPVAEMVYQHHERLDGSGYPQGLRGDAICLEARILAVADVFEAITAHRPYRPAKDRDEAIAELLRGRGRTYDAAVVDALLATMDQVAPPGDPPPGRSPCN